MFAIAYDYLLLNALLLATFSICGYRVSRGSIYWANALICIVVYVFVLGSRYGRGNDYFHYLGIYYYGLNFEQKLFTWFNDYLKSINTNPLFIFYYYAIPYIIGAMVFLYQYKKYAAYMFPLFLVATIFFEEYQIRQAVSFSFVYLCLYEMFRQENVSFIHGTTYRKYFLIPLYLFIIYHVHTASFYLLLFIIFAYYSYHKIIPLKISIPLYIIGSFVISSMHDLSFLNPIIDYFSTQHERFERYAENADKWFSAEGYNSIYTRNFIVKIFETIGHISLFVLSRKYILGCCNSRGIVCLTNVFIIGSIFRQSFINLEILNRMGGNYAMFWFVPLSVVLYHRKQLKTTFFEKLCFWGLLFWAYDYLKYLFMRGEMTRFIWDIVKETFE